MNENENEVATTPLLSQESTPKKAPENAFTEKIKSLRRRAWVVLEGLKLYEQENGKTRESSLAFTAAQTGRHFLGEVLKELGTNAYPESKDPASRKIEPTADTYDDLVKPEGYDDMDGIAKSKYWRKEITTIVDELKKETENMIEGTSVLEGPAHFWIVESLCASVENFKSSCHWMGEVLSKLSGQLPIAA